ncbi:MAG: hypothetical protein SNG27_07585 [Rikenellaceae bacterium]
MDIPQSVYNFQLTWHRLASKWQRLALLEVRFDREYPITLHPSSGNNPDYYNHRNGANRYSRATLEKLRD